MKAKKFLSSALALTLFATLALPGLSAEDTSPRIDVTGDAELRVSPDEAVLTLGVESWAAELASARKENDSKVSKVLKVPTDMGVDKKFVQTDFLSIEPIYDVDSNNNNIRSIASYRIKKSITIVLKDLTKLDALVSNVLNAGANRFDGIEFRSTDLRKYRDQARSMAILAAKEKATALAGDLGQKLLQPIQINELAEGPYPAYRMMAQNAVGFADGGGSDGGSTMSIGQIVIRSQVSVSFTFAAK